MRFLTLYILSKKLLDSARATRRQVGCPCHSDTSGTSSQAEPAWMKPYWTEKRSDSPALKGSATAGIVSRVGLERVNEELSGSSGSSPRPGPGAAHASRIRSSGSPPRSARRFTGRAPKTLLEWSGTERGMVRKV